MNEIQVDDWVFFKNDGQDYIDYLQSRKVNPFQAGLEPKDFKEMMCVTKISNGLATLSMLHRSIQLIPTPIEFLEKVQRDMVELGRLIVKMRGEKV